MYKFFLKKNCLLLFKTGFQSMFEELIINGLFENFIKLAEDLKIFIFDHFKY